MFMNKKAVSTLTLIILIVSSAIVGGIISYMLTIAYYVETGYNIPENSTTLAITDVYIDPEDATSFKITILNPSFSVSNATVTRIAVSVANETDLYEVVETQPPIEDGLVIPRGKAINITCSALQVKGKKMYWGEFAYTSRGQLITIHVFSENSSSANRMEKLPFVELEVTPIFGNTFKNFTIKLKNDKNSETALTINSVELLDVEGSKFADFLYKRQISLKIPELPVTLEQDQSITLTCQLNWFGINKTTIYISTEQGYQIYVKNITLPQIYFEIKNVTFNVDYTDRFNITMVNYRDSERIAIVKRVEIAADGKVTYINHSMPLPVGTELNYTCMWDWLNYRGKKLNVTVFLKQDINQSFQVTTPPPVILRLVNEDSVFDLKDKNHFNITIQNHRSSLEALNITKIQIDHVVLNGSRTNPELPLHSYLNPGEVLSIICNYTWEEDARNNKNLTIIIYAITNETEKYQFKFTFTPPRAELNITSVEFIESEPLNNLNITVENLPYSIINLTITKIMVSFENGTQICVKQWSPGFMMLAPNESCNISFEVDKRLLDTNITVSVITKEGIEFIWSGIPSTGSA